MRPILHEHTPVVALHSSASCGGQWKELVSALEQRYQIYTPDLPGYGPEVAPANEVGIMGDARGIIQLIQGLDEPVHLIGHSYGGAVALKVATMIPSLVKSLTLFEPVMVSLLKDRGIRETESFNHFQYLASELAGAINTGKPEQGMAAFIDFWNGEGFWSTLPEKHKTHFIKLATSVFANFEKAFNETLTVQDLEYLHIPTLLMSGMESPAVTQSICELLSRSIPQSRYAMLPGLGHMAPVTAAEWVNPRIEHHLAEIEYQQATGVRELRWAA
jgi:pimeloyl-ACP methyl ester carboxylesterase